MLRIWKKRKNEAEDVDRKLSVQEAVARTQQARLRRLEEEASRFKLRERRS